MQTFLRALRLFAMVIWVGGLVFFAFVLAPTAFSVLSSKHDAGLVVGGTLRILHHIGLVSGAVFYLATGLLWLRADVDSRISFAIEMVLAAMMLASTFYSQNHILPAMEVDRAKAGGIIESAPADNPGHIDFDRLHKLSERVEGLVLLCGLGVLFMMARESVWPEAGKIVRS